MKRLPEFKNGMDARCRDFNKPTVARFLDYRNGFAFRNYLN